jgi:RNA polymerase sigma-70 factor (ECF subfamily)
MAIYIDDRELVAAHQAGDAEAFEELVREHRRALLVHARRKLNCDAAAEDAVQETLVRAFRALPKFNGEYRLGPWLHRIMGNVCIDEVHRRQRDGAKLDQLKAEPLNRSEGASVEEELGLEIDTTALNNALEEIADPYREALVLRFVDDLTYDEVAELSGVSEQNARARVSRARIAMRSLMKGVASVPGLLAIVLKRGEKAAAAATSTGGAITAGSSGATAMLSTAIPAVTEASVVTAPAVVPVIAKAAVGIGIAAAVFTPTTDSAVHNAVEHLASGPAGIVVEYQTENVSTADSGSEAIDSNSNVALPDYSPLETVSPETSESISENVPVSQQSAAPPTVTPEFLTTTGLITIDQLVVSQTRSGRHEISGAVEIAVGEVNGRGVLLNSSWLHIAEEVDREGRRRVDALLLIEGSEFAAYEVQLAGFAMGENEQLQITGLFRASSNDAGTATAGSFSGSISLGAVAKPATLTLLP